MLLNCLELSIRCIYIDLASIVSRYLGGLMLKYRGGSIEDHTELEGFVLMFHTLYMNHFHPRYQ